jgi:hypothetical protein
MIKKILESWVMVWNGTESQNPNKKAESLLNFGGKLLPGMG